MEALIFKNVYTILYWGFLIIPIVYCHSSCLLRLTSFMVRIPIDIYIYIYISVDR